MLLPCFSHVNSSSVLMVVYINATRSPNAQSCVGKEVNKYLSLCNGCPCSERRHAIATVVPREGIIP